MRRSQHGCLRPSRGHMSAALNHPQRGERETGAQLAAPGSSASGQGWNRENEKGASPAPPPKVGLQLDSAGSLLLGLALQVLCLQGQPRWLVPQQLSQPGHLPYLPPSSAAGLRWPRQFPSQSRGRENVGVEPDDHSSVPAAFQNHARSTNTRSRFILPTTLTGRPDSYCMSETPQLRQLKNRPKYANILGHMLYTLNVHDVVCQIYFFF